MSYEELKFTRSSVAKILGCTTQTVANREKSGKYFPARRGSNNYRYYTLLDVLLLQVREEGRYNRLPILAELWDRGYRDEKVAGQIIDTAVADFEATQRNDSPEKELQVNAE